MSIAERQNTPESLAKLAAQRLLYSRAKRVRNIGALLVLTIAMLGLAASVSADQCLGQFLPLFALTMWFVDQEVLKRMEARIRTEAATIQEDFDCFVLDLPWPTHKGIDHPTSDRLRQLSEEAKSKPGISEGLRDWYSPAAIPEHPLLSKIHCQRINHWWELTLRKRWNGLLTVGSWSFVFVVLLLSVCTGITVAKFAAIAASNLRVIAWARDEVRDRFMEIQQMDRMHRHLSSYTAENVPSPSDIRSVQDEVYELRRSKSPLPEWFYWLNRDRLERETGKPMDDGETT